MGLPLGIFALCELLSSPDVSPLESCPPVIRRGNSKPRESRAQEELSLLASGASSAEQ